MLLCRFLCFSTPIAVLCYYDVYKITKHWQTSPDWSVLVDRDKSCFSLSFPDVALIGVVVAVLEPIRSVEIFLLYISMVEGRLVTAVRFASLWPSACTLLSTIQLMSHRATTCLSNNRQGRMTSLIERCFDRKTVNAPWLINSAFNRALLGVARSHHQNFVDYILLEWFDQNFLVWMVKCHDYKQRNLYVVSIKKSLGDVGWLSVDLCSERFEA